MDILQEGNYYIEFLYSDFFQDAKLLITWLNLSYDFYYVDGFLHSEFTNKIKIPKYAVEGLLNHIIDEICKKHQYPRRLVKSNKILFPHCFIPNKTEKMSYIINEIISTGLTKEHIWEAKKLELWEGVQDFFYYYAKCELK